MEDQDVFFDAGALIRTATLFAAKRREFAEDALEALTTDIVGHLASRARPDPVLDGTGINDASVDAFCDALIDPTPDAALEFIERRRAEGVTRQGVYLGYVGAAARRLGERWEGDLLSFADVTIGSGHLYALMRAMRAERPTKQPPYDARRRALFATVPSEHHSVGITVAANLFRDAGWEIDTQVGRDHNELLAHVERTRPQIIGLSLSTENRFGALVRLVVAMRIVMHDAIIGVAPAANLNSERILDLVDIDLLFEDALSARAQLEQMIELRC